MPYGYRNIKKAKLIGDYSEAMGDATCLELGQLIGGKLQELGHCKVLIGRNEGLLSKRIWRSLVDGLLNCGVSVADLGVAIVPVLDYSRELISVQATIMISSRGESSYYTLVIGANEELFTMGTTVDALLDRGRIGLQPLGGSGQGIRGSYRSYDCSAFYVEMLDKSLEKLQLPLRVALAADSDIELSYAQDIIKILGGEPICRGGDCGSEKNHGSNEASIKTLEALKDLMYHESCDAAVHISQSGDHIEIFNISGAPVEFRTKNNWVEGVLPDKFHLMGTVMKQLERFPDVTQHIIDSSGPKDLVSFAAVAG